MSIPEKAILVTPKWTKSQVATLTKTVAKGLSTDELQLFLYVCKRSGLDPFLRQIYALKLWDAEINDFKLVIVTGIDGFRLAGHRTNRVAGMPVAEFEVDPNEAWHPSVARVTVKMFSPTGTGEIIDFVGEARWKEFSRKKKDGQYMKMWSENGNPFNQLAKCAEAQGWRKAAPMETVGLLVKEEAVDIDFSILEEGPATGAVAPEGPAGTMYEGRLIEYVAPISFKMKTGKEGKKPGYVIIESGDRKYRESIFHRPACFDTDEEGIQAAAAKADVQFSEEIKGEYHNLKHMALKPQGGAAHEAGHSEQGSPAPQNSPPSEGEMAEADYREMLQSAASVVKVRAIFNDAIQVDPKLDGPRRKDLKQFAKERIEALEGKSGLF